MEELRPDMKDAFCRVVSEQINDTIIKMVKNNCQVTIKRKYIENFNDACNNVDVDYFLLNNDELEQKWKRGETVRITRIDKKVVTLPRKGDFDREVEEIICLPPKKADDIITDLLFYIDLGEIACSMPKPVSLSDQDREMFWSIAKSRH